jgi:hypothetical protein
MPPAAKKHTIILVQYVPAFSSRSFMDFPTTKEAMEACVKMYETKLKELNPDLGKIDYTIEHLYNYLDSLHDICALVLDPSSNKYEPYDRNWIKTQIFDHLKTLAGGGK